VTETSPRVDSRDTVLASRRVALQAAALTALAFVATGCGVDRLDGSHGTGAPVPSRTGATTALDADIRLVTEAIADEEGVGDFYAAAARRFPAQRALLGGLVVRQRMHVTRLRGSLTNLSPRVTHTRSRVPPHAQSLPVALASLALRARNSRSADCLTATSGLLAELFASMAAAHAITVLLVEPRVAATTVSRPDSVTPADELQPCLAAEHAAVFGYGLLGGVLSAGVSHAPAAEASVSSYEAHRARRDALTELISAAGLQPVAAEAAYDTPFPVAGVPTARRLARYIEARCAAVYARATAATSGDARLLVSETLVDCATRGARWGTAPAAFPGLDES